MTMAPPETQQVAPSASQSAQIGADDTPAQPGNQGEQSVRAVDDAASASSPKGTGASPGEEPKIAHPPPPNVALECIDKHMAKLNGHVEDRERLALAGIERKVRKPYIRRWVRESNQFFRLIIHLKHRRARISKRNSA